MFRRDWTRFSCNIVNLFLYLFVCLFICFLFRFLKRNGFGPTKFPFHSATMTYDRSTALDIELYHQTRHSSLLYMHIP